MEPIRVRGSLRCHWVRRIRGCNSRSAYASAADQSFDAAGENVFACVSHLCTRAKLDLLAATLAQLLDARVCFKGARQNNRSVPYPMPGVNVINTLV